MMDAAEEPLKMDETLREDYAIGVFEDKSFYISYRCECAECCFAFEFRHDVLDATKKAKK